MVSYNFEMAQKMKVAVFDADTAAGHVNALDLSKQDSLGSVEFALADAARDTGKPLILQLPKKGSVAVSVEEVVNFKKSLAFSMRGQKLADKDWCGTLLALLAHPGHLTICSFLELYMVECLADKDWCGLVPLPALSRRVAWVTGQVMSLRLGHGRRPLQVPLCCRWFATHSQG